MNDLYIQDMGTSSINDFLSSNSILGQTVQNDTTLYPYLDYGFSTCNGNWDCPTGSSQFTLNAGSSAGSNNIPATVETGSGINPSNPFESPYFVGAENLIKSVVQPLTGSNPNSEINLQGNNITVPAGQGDSLQTFLNTATTAITKDLPALPAGINWTDVLILGVILIIAIIIRG